MSYGARQLLSDGRPRGTVPVSDRAAAAVRQLREGTATRAEVARLYGVSTATISDWISRVREAEEDAANMQGGR